MWDTLGIQKQKNPSQSILQGIFAEAEGFEPPERCRSTVFKTAAIDHSATPPVFRRREDKDKILPAKNYFTDFSVFSSGSSLLAKNLYWKKIRYKAPTVTQLSAKLKTGAKKRK